MGHLREVGHHGGAAALPTQGERELQRLGGKLLAGQDIPQVHRGSMLVRDLHPHRRLAGNRRHDPDAHRLQPQRQIVRQGNDPVDLDAGAGFQLIARDNRPGVHRRHPALDPELQELLFQKTGVLGHLLRVGTDLLRRPRIEELHGGFGVPVP